MGPFVPMMLVGPEAPSAGKPRLEARLLETGNGLPGTADLIVEEPGRLRVEGLRFHMPGRWRLQMFDEAGRELARHEVMVR